MRRALVLVTTAAAMTVPVASANAATILVKDDFFSPKSKTYKLNTLVTFKWAGEAPHDVVAKRSGNMSGADVSREGVCAVGRKRSPRGLPAGAPAGLKTASTSEAASGPDGCPSQRSTCSRPSLMPRTTA